MTMQAQEGFAQPPWYEEFFNEFYWVLADAEYTSERTARELSYLSASSAELGPRLNVLDLGCGQGRHAIPLANAGHNVLGVDVSNWALARAMARVGGERVLWQAGDLLRSRFDGFGRPDLVVCIQSFGWGSDAQQLSMLRRLSRCMAPRGRLVLDHSDVSWILRNYVPKATFQTGDLQFEFQRNYSQATGRSCGTIEVRRCGQPVATLRDSIRLYSTVELIALLREAGFEVEGIDADFIHGAPVTLDTRYVQVIARTRSGPPRGLAVFNYEKSTQPPPDAVDLRWSPDEAEFVPGVSYETPDMDLRRYRVDDPYGECEALPVLERHFETHLDAACVTFAAGVSSLLRSFGSFAARGVVLSPYNVHPDLSAWAQVVGGRVVNVPDSKDGTIGFDASALLASSERERPRLIHVDRPDITGNCATFQHLTALCASCEAWGGVVVVDESRANYLGPSESAVRLVNELGNLVVLRGMSKAYCVGGFRVGFAVAPRSLADDIRAWVCPMEVSQHGYAGAKQLLQLGDVFSRLRERTGFVKPPFVESLRAQGLSVLAENRVLPWVLVDEGSRSGLLQSLGIVGMPVDLAQVDGRRTHLWRLAVPLSTTRVQRAMEALAPFFER